MKLICILLLQCYAALFSSETNNAINFIKQNSGKIKEVLHRHTPEERKIAMAIVAPEISQYSSASNFLELRALFISYKNFGKGDFSVGYFQMKPSFIEALEKEISANNNLKKKYGSYLLSGTQEEIRSARLKRLSSLEWQLKYLEVFMDVARIKTAGMSFKGSMPKLRYWATLYNSGFHSSPKRVAEMQKKKYFPRKINQYNYADVAVEFYQLLPPL